MRRTSEHRPVVRGNAAMGFEIRQSHFDPDGTRVIDEIGLLSVSIDPESGEQEWHPDGADVPPRAIGAVIFGAALIALLVLCVLFGSALARSSPSVPVHTPTTYNPPSTVYPS